VSFPGLALDEDTNGSMPHHIPSITGMAILLPVQLFLLAAWGVALYGDLHRDCRTRPVVVTLLTGTVVAILFRLAVLLITNDGTYGARCRSFYNNDLPDSFWIAADLVEQGLLGYGGLGLTLAWLLIRYSVRGIRATKTTLVLGGALAGLGVGAIVEYARIHWGNSGAADPPRLVFCALLGAFLSLASRPFLFRKGRFQFGIKSLLAYTVVWALVFGWLGPQWSRYQAESETLGSVATLLGAPVQCERIEGFTGLAYVNTVYLPRCAIADAQVDAIIPHLQNLSHLHGVQISSATLSEEGKRRLRSALPKVAIGTCSSSDDYREEILPSAKEPECPAAPDQPPAKSSSPQ
jgi:hypothetical protein